MKLWSLEYSFQFTQRKETDLQESMDDERMRKNGGELYEEINRD